MSPTTMPAPTIVVDAQYVARTRAVPAEGKGKGKGKGRTVLATNANANASRSGAAAKSSKPTSQTQTLRRRLKYLQYRPDQDGSIPQQQGQERWLDRGLGSSYGAILQHCQQLGSRSVLAWTWVIAPDPRLLRLIPEERRRAFLVALTEQVVEAYYAARGIDYCEYSFAVHDRALSLAADSPSYPVVEAGVGTPRPSAGAGIPATDAALQNLHSHVILPGTVPLEDGSRQAFFNNAIQGHFHLLQDSAQQVMESLLTRELALTRTHTPGNSGISDVEPVPTSQYGQPAPESALAQLDTAMEPEILGL